MSESERFEDSPEFDEWIEKGGRDEEESDYYNDWHRRMLIEEWTKGR
ncbi:hypothetical protein ACR71G_03495 [Xenorhabdus bovienii]|nr:hypothetical protein [Xenorhabdus bovienii]